MRRTPKAKQEVIKLVGGSTFGRYGKISSSKTFNMFVSDKWLVNTQGYQRVLQILAQGQGRGLFVSVRGNFMIVVVNANVYQIDQFLNVTQIGTINTAIGEVTIDENLSSQICIVDGVEAWIYNWNPPTALTLQVTPNLQPNYVEYHNSFFLFGNALTNANGSAWYAYEMLTPTTIQQKVNGGQFAIQTKPDNALAVLRLPGLGSNVIVFGNAVCEIWTQVAGVQNYRKNTTINIDYGCLSVNTIAASDKFVAWLGVNQTNKPVMMVFTGQTAERISTDGIDFVLQSIQFPKESTAMFFRQGGHLFYQLTFTNPVDNLTLLYDFDGAEGERFYHFTDANLNFHPARDYVYFNGTSYFISLKNASLYEADTQFTTYNENLISNPNPDPILNFEIPRTRVPETTRSIDSSQFRANSFVFTIEQGQDVNVSGASLLNNEDLLITEDLFAPPDDIIYTEFGVPMADEDSGGGPANINAGNLPPPYQPRVDLNISFDGGLNFGNTVSRPLNPVGIRQNILNWENMGMCNSWTPQLRFWGLSRFVLYDGQLEIY